ncbi:MAG: flagellar assembly protein FliW [Syntrophorhabdaceae bacterium]|nr:flagellar assembly protein FliW [Syntrophorhabdaceae bacterium]
MSEIMLKGKIIGFEDYEDYFIDAPFGEDSPFRLLTCHNQGLSFILVNPYHIIDDYTFDIDDKTVMELFDNSNPESSIAVLCVVRPTEETLYVNLRSPIVINVKKGRFVQVILENEGYGVSVPFAIKKTALQNEE